MEPQEKDNAIAVLLSLLITGAGQIYAGATTRGIIQVVIYLMLWMLTGVTLGLMWIVLIPYWIWGMFDTNKQVKKYNYNLGMARKQADAVHQAAANAPQPTHLAQPIPPLAHQAAANAPQPAPFRCLLEGQDSTGRPFALTISALALGDRAGVTLGRSPANAEFIINHKEVSREHVRLMCADGELYAEDLNALNGTKVNGRLLNPREQVLLRDNDRLEVGPVVFTVHLV